MNKNINALLWIGLIGTLTIGTNFITSVYRAFHEDTGIWWTHHSMKLPIEQTVNSFEIYIREKQLSRHVSEGTLLSVDKNGEQHRVVSGDIGVRLNNWDKNRASILTHAIIGGFISGITITLLITGLIQVFARKKRPS